MQQLGFSSLGLSSEDRPPAGGFFAFVGDVDVAIEPRVTTRSVDLSHAAGADRGHDFIRAKLGAGG